MLIYFDGLKLYKFNTISDLYMPGKLQDNHIETWKTCCIPHPLAMLNHGPACHVMHHIGDKEMVTLFGMWKKTTIMNLAVDRINFYRLRCIKLCKSQDYLSTGAGFLFFCHWRTCSHTWSMARKPLMPSCRDPRRRSPKGQASIRMLAGKKIWRRRQLPLKDIAPSCGETKWGVLFVEKYNKTNLRNVRILICSLHHVC